jgi:hypothetical protein
MEDIFFNIREALWGGNTYGIVFTGDQPSSNPFIHPSSPLGEWSSPPPPITLLHTSKEGVKEGS